MRELAKPRHEVWVSVQLPGAERVAVIGGAGRGRLPPQVVQQRGIRWQIGQRPRLLHAPSIGAPDSPDAAADASTPLPGSAVRLFDDRECATVGNRRVRYSRS